MAEDEWQKRQKMRKFVQSIVNFYQLNYLYITEATHLLKCDISVFSCNNVQWLKQLNQLDMTLIKIMEYRLQQ